jgi:hypothetical protein
MTFYQSTIVLVTLIASGACAAPRRAASTIRVAGKIVAYRPADRLQLASFVKNKELFLFSTKEIKPKTIKLVYSHYGYSDISYEMLLSTMTIQLSARRDFSCDETLSSFKSSAPAILDENGSDASAERVIFVEKLQDISGNYQLDCYVLTKWVSQSTGEGETKAGAPAPK